MDLQLTGLRVLVTGVCGTVGRQRHGQSDHEGQDGHDRDQPDALLEGKRPHRLCHLPLRTALTESSSAFRAMTFSRSTWPRLVRVWNGFIVLLRGRSFLAF